MKRFKGIFYIFIVISIALVFSHYLMAEKKLSEREEMFYKYLKLSSYVKGGTIEPHWMADGSSFWYVEEAPDNAVAYKVDPRANTRSVLFDIPKLREALQAQIGHELPYKGLPFAEFTFINKENSIQFDIEGKKFICDLATYSISQPFSISLWQKWAQPRVLDRGLNAPIKEVPSPDGNWFLLDRDYNIWLRSAQDGRMEQLTSDGVENLEWSIKLYPFWLGAADAKWSPDSYKIVVAKIDSREVLTYPLIHWLKPREEVEWLKEVEAGGPMPQMELYIIDIVSRKKIRIDTGREQDNYFRIIGWKKDGSELIFTRLDREHKKWELMAADPKTGASRLILAETQETFIIGHPSMPAWNDAFTPLADGTRFIWLSERDGWNHLYLYDYEGNLIQRLTKGRFPVVRVVAVDEKNEYVYFTAHAEERIYDTHLYRVDFQGSGFKRLTEQHGQHSPRFSPDKKYFLDTHSSIDRPPAVELRNADGQLLQVVSQGSKDDLSELQWSPPEEFVVKAADNKTDIYGVMYKPYDFNPEKKYPVIEHIYAGPYRTQVPRTFTSGPRRWALAPALAQLGFIVIQVDGRGTPERGKAFQDVAYKSFGRHEIPDHAAALKQLGEQKPYLDLDRVGIYGSSWGGYMTLRALLLAPDTYHVGVAMSELPELQDMWLHEIYLGLPENSKEAYEYSSNLKIAGNLEGKLLLMKGTSDPWCRLAHTLHMAEALIRAGKFFDMLIMPERTHHLAYTYPLPDADWEEIQKEMLYSWEVVRRYFQEHLRPNH
ncbi:DPP IV N-terminal domain-containing protein [Acidobacteriota bacterium]